MEDDKNFGFWQKTKFFILKNTNKIKDLLKNQNGDILGIDSAVKVFIAIVLGVLLLGLCTYLVNKMIYLTSGNVENVMNAEYDVGNMTGIAPGMISGFFLR